MSNQRSVADPRRLQTAWRNRRDGPSATEFSVGATLVIVTALWLPAFAPSTTPRLAAMLVVTPAGLLALSAAVRSGVRAAQFGAAYLVWGIICSIASPTRWPSLMGGFFREMSMLILVAGFASWALARHVRPSMASALRIPFVLALLANVVVGAAQVVSPRESGLLSLLLGRASGLMGGPVYFGSIMAGAAGFAACAYRRRLTIAAPLVLVFGAAVNWSGARFPTVVGLVAVATAPLLARRVRAAVVLSASYVGGVLLGALLLTVSTQTTGSTARIGAESAGRLEAWKYGLEAFADRPFLGWGAAVFRGAIQARTSPAFAVNHAEADIGQIWFDAHNIVVANAVWFGAFGLILALGFAYCAVREGSGPYLAFAIVVASNWLLQPSNIATVSIVGLTLGLASTRSQLATAGPATDPGSDDRIDADRAARTDGQSGSVARSLLLLGVVLGLTLLALDLRMKAAQAAQDPDRVASAASWTPWDPVAANTAASAYINWNGDREASEKALDWMRRAADLQPDFAFYRRSVAELEFRLGMDAAAAESLRTALAIEPLNERTLHVIVDVEDRLDDEALVAEAHRRLCTLQRARGEVQSCPS